MKRASYKWLFLGGSLLIPAALVEASANGSPSGRDTTQVTAEAISQTPDDTPADLGFLEYLFKRKRTEDGEQTTDGEQALAGADVPEAYNGPVEELGLLDILLGKEPQPLVIGAGIHEANETVPEPQMDPLPEVGLISYLINRGNRPIIPASDPAQAVNPSRPTSATSRSSISTSQVLARSATAVESAVISEDLLRIKVVLGQLPRSALASLKQSNQVAATPKIENDAPVVENTDPQLELTQKHDSPGPATPADVEEKGLLELLLHRSPKATVNEEPVVANTEPEIEVAQKDDSPDSAAPAEVEEKGLLELLLHRRTDAARVEATKTPSGDNNGN